MCWRRMVVSCIHHVKNEEVLHKLKEEYNQKKECELVTCCIGTAG
jgi:hypothetical protein